MNWLKRKWREWRAARSAELRKRGYSYAAGQLLLAKGDQPTLERLESEASDTFDFNDFDQGILDALFDWTHLHPTLTLQTVSKLRDWVYESWSKKAPGVAAFAAREGIDLASIEAEIKADSHN